MLIAMLVTWAQDGKPHYSSMNADQHIAWVDSDGPDGIKC